MRHQPGRHALQIPGPTNVPGAVRETIGRPTNDHRGPAFQAVGREVLAGIIRTIVRTAAPVIIDPASGTGAWEVALVNTLSPGDAVLPAETGWFAALWCRMAERLGLELIALPGDWRSPADPAAMEARLAEHRAGRMKAVAVVHNETSTGVVSGSGSWPTGCSASAIWAASTISRGMATLSGVELGLRALGVPVDAGGLGAALETLPGNAAPSSFAH